MAYGTRAKVEELMAQFVLSTSSKPTGVMTDNIIADTDAEIETHLAAAGIGVPVTTPSYFHNWLCRLSAYGATAAVLKSMFPAAVGPGEVPAFAFWEARYRAGIRGIDDGSLVPADLVTSAHITPSTYFTRNPDLEEHLGNIAEPFFKRGKVF